MTKQRQDAAKKNGFSRIPSTLWRWVKRAFFGASKELTDDEKFAIEKIESPSVMAAKAFFRRKLAVVALCVLVALFLFVFVGPYFVPMDLNYTDPLQANMAPNYSLMSVPDELKNDIRDINGFADFTVGVSNDNDFYIWGNVKNNLTGVDYTAYPEEIRPGNVVAASAGADHIIAITTDGKVVGWGNGNNGQYGYLKSENDPYTQMPDELLEGTIDATQVRQLLCGYQASALVMEDGRLYMWGNNNAMLSLREFATNERYNTGVKKVAFSNYYAILLREDGTVTGGQTLTFNMQSAYSNKDGQIKNLRTYLTDRTVVDIAATNNCYCFVMDDGSLLVFARRNTASGTSPRRPRRSASWRSTPARGISSPSARAGGSTPGATTTAASAMWTAKRARWCIPAPSRPISWTKKENCSTVPASAATCWGPTTAAATS